MDATGYRFWSKVGPFVLLVVVALAYMARNEMLWRAERNAIAQFYLPKPTAIIGAETDDPFVYLSEQLQYQPLASPRGINRLKLILGIEPSQGVVTMLCIDTEESFSEFRTHPDGTKEIYRLKPSEVCDARLLRHVRYLYIWGNITTEHIDYIADVPNLETLELGGELACSSSELVQSITRLKTLRKIDFTNLALDRSEAQDIQDFANIQKSVEAKF